MKGEGGGKFAIKAKLDKDWKGKIVTNMRNGRIGTIILIRNNPLYLLESDHV